MTTTSKYGPYCAVLLFMFFAGSTATAGLHRASSATQVDSVCKIAAPGDTITMNSGTWNNQIIIFKTNGTAEKPVVLRSEQYGNVILTGSSRLKIGGNYLVAEGLIFQNTFTGSGDIIEFRDGSNTPSNNCRLTRTSIKDYNPVDKSAENKWVSIYGTYNRVDYCSFENKTNYGTTLVVWLSNTPNHHRIDHNYFGPRPPLNDNGGETIRVGTSDWSMYDSFTTVESNYFDRCNGEIEIISSKSCENIYRYNVFVSCEGNLTLRHGNRCSIYGNYFFCNAASNSGGIRIIGEDHKVYNNYIENSAGSSMKTGITLTNGVPNSPLNRYFPVKRALIVFNTLIGNRYSFNIGAGKDSELSLPPSDCVIANNLVWSTKSPLITYTDTPINMNYAGNMFYGATLGISKPEGIEIVDPKISFTTDSLWRLTGDSPAIDSAVGSYSFVTVDVDGQPRVAPFDIGADEYSSATITQRPIRKSEVGPAGVVMSVKKGLAGQIPKEFGIIRNYPNPFNPTTIIDFAVATAGKAALRVYNVIGEEVAFLFNGDVLAGQIYHSTFDAGRLPSGLYFARLESANLSLTKKMLLMK